MTAGNQVAGALTEDNPWAMLGGSLLGGAPVPLASAYLNAPAKALKQAVGDLTPQQLEQALARQSNARTTGAHRYRRRTCS